MVNRTIVLEQDSNSTSSSMTCVPHNVALTRLSLMFAGRCSGEVPSANSYTGNKLFSNHQDLQTSSLHHKSNLRDHFISDDESTYSKTSNHSVPYHCIQFTATATIKHYTLLANIHVNISPNYTISRSLHSILLGSTAYTLFYTQWGTWATVCANRPYTTLYHHTTHTSKTNTLSTDKWGTHSGSPYKGVPYHKASQPASPHCFS